ncbi:DUF3168 domain-containing protein [Kosakonia cowanii]|uniref:tail completion protein gp17 n=1 Tax=Kosakonia cowanii TaxID=208223 RepID=UPI0039A6DD13
MTEADAYALLRALADGQVYPGVVPLNSQGEPAVAPPWITFTLVVQTYGDTFCGPAEEETSLQVDVYASSADEARALRQQAIAALMPLAFTRLSKTGGYEPETGLRRATFEVHILQ